MGNTHMQRGAGVLGTTALLFLLPLATYWRTIFHRYGLRDDYAILREAQEEPGKILRVCAAHGRPLYGWLLELSARVAGEIDGLCWQRLAGVVCLGLLSAVVFLILGQLGWHLPQAALLSATLSMLPSAQVIASWAICWPQAPASLMGPLAFALSEGATRHSSGLLRWSRWLLAVLVMAAATLTYQPSGLFYAVLVAAALAVRHHDTIKDTLRWLVRHLCVMAAGLGSAFVFMKILFAAGVFRASPRITFELHWLDKAIWAITEVLPNSLALLVIEDVRDASARGFWVMVVLTLAIVTAGILIEGRRTGSPGRWRWILGLVALSAVAYGISFLAKERWPTYRTLYALTGVWTVFFAASLVNIGSCWPARGQKVATALLACFAVTSVLLAYQQSFELFAVPQSRELARMEARLRQIEPEERPRIFVVTARQTDSSAPRRYLDEFGSISVDAEWVAKEMLKQLMKERFPEVRDVSGLYRFAAGPRAPEPKNYDVLIDMRESPPAYVTATPLKPPTAKGGRAQ
ncbi:hypothetical protein F0U61_39375 [Archangium violaceum]|uniref:glucosyltransferase domain-containing protein n=1 Tax=Archangium violaceum TaxID=83451 RepID=UPI002B2D42A0|nr:hypothetical protein F0U61_39375 [Archangium violaceum]